MAKKKRKSRRRRVSGIGAALNPSSPIAKVAALAAGYLLADKINGAISSIVPASQAATVGKILPYAEVGLGGLLLMKGKSSLVKTAAGGLLAGAGLKTVLTQLGVVKGYQSVPVIGAAKRVAGYQAVPVIGSADTPAQLQGIDTPAQLQGYRINGYTPNGSGVGRVMGSLYANGSGLNQHDATGYMSN